MANYNDIENYNNSRQRDLVLAANEFCFLQNKTNGVIKTYTGPITMTISAQEALVVFNEKTKQFKETDNFEEAKQLLVSPPENWYVVLKNPSEGNVHPEAGKAVISPNLEVGKKINISGPCAFSLFPGQMAKIIKGHHLRSNQYLLARVYDPEAAQNSVAVMVDAEGNTITTNEKYYAGQMLVIKGTEISFYIPPTGIEVIPIENNPKNGYVREAVTLERLEYAILKDENGNKTYKYGPEVVFPKPTETFVQSPTGGNIFRVIELSPISGIYVKVIAEYTEGEGENAVTHPAGEEMFITGNDQMIYYPRPEHAIISYDNKIMHHAIAIPEGEGRYVMNRMTGEIKTIKGPAMFLPDPRTEVVVKRKLSEKQCDLWFPGSVAAKSYNASLNEKSVEKSSRITNTLPYTDTINKSITASCDASLDAAYSTANSLSATLANLESNASISRGTSYTKPRTITLDNKYDGVVSIDVWTGYAVNVISKSGKRKVVCGPQTILLDYDQTLEELQMSTGKPKTTDKVIHTVYLRHENNKVSDIISVETKDFVRCEVEVSYNVSFDKAQMDKWFNVDNYVKYLCDKMRSEVKKEVKKYGIEEFYQNYSTIVHEVVLTNKIFVENGMNVQDCEVLSIHIEDNVAEMLIAHQEEMLTQSLKLSDAEKRVEVAEKLADAERKEQELRNEALLNKLDLQEKEALRKLEIQTEIARQTEANKLAEKQAEVDMQVLYDTIHNANLERTKLEKANELAHQRELAEIEKNRNEAYAATVKTIMESISEDLVAAMSSKSNNEMTIAIAQALSPYALASGESVTDVVNGLLRGTKLEDVIKGINLNVNND